MEQFPKFQEKLNQILKRLRIERPELFINDKRTYGIGNTNGKFKGKNNHVDED